MGNMHMDMIVIDVTDFKSEVRFDFWDNLESNIGNYCCRSWEAPLLLLKVLPGKEADSSLHRAEYLHFLW